MNLTPRVTQGSARRSPALIYAESWGTGGIESYVMELVSRLYAEGITVDVISTHDSSVIHDEVLYKYGATRSTLFPGRRPNNIKRLIFGLWSFNRIIKNRSYNIIHINTLNGSRLLYAAIARARGVKSVIVHSHNSDVGVGAHTVKLILHRLFQTALAGGPFYRLACSSLAGTYLFGRRPFQIARNGIDCERYRYDEIARKRTRSELGLSDGAFLIGNPSRIAPAKNPLFQLEVFKTVLALRPDSYYLMMKGEGDLEKEIRAFIANNRLENRVLRVSPRETIEELYSAMDVLLFPSKFEGMPLTVIEAQCSGLPVIASDTLPAEAAITELLTSLPLNQSIDSWAQLVISLGERKLSTRTQWAEVVAREGYSVEKALAPVVRIYQDSIKSKTNFNSKRTNLNS